MNAQKQAGRNTRLHMKDLLDDAEVFEPVIYDVKC